MEIDEELVGRARCGEVVNVGPDHDLLLISSAEFRSILHGIEDSVERRAHALASNIPTPTIEELRHIVTSRLEQGASIEP